MFSGELQLKRISHLFLGIVENFMILPALIHLQINRLRQVFDHLKTLNSLCKVLGLDSKQTVTEIHPSMDDSIGCKNISSNTIDKLVNTIRSLQEVKTQRMHRVGICINLVSTS